METQGLLLPHRCCACIQCRSCKRIPVVASHPLTNWYPVSRKRVRSQPALHGRRAPNPRTSCSYEGQATAKVRVSVRLYMQAGPCRVIDSNMRPSVWVAPAVPRHAERGCRYTARCAPLCLQSPASPVACTRSQSLCAHCATLSLRPLACDCTTKQAPSMGRRKAVKQQNSWAHLLGTDFPVSLSTTVLLTWCGFACTDSVHDFSVKFSVPLESIFLRLSASTAAPLLSLLSCTHLLYQKVTLRLRQEVVIPVGRSESEAVNRMRELGTQD